MAGWDTTQPLQKKFQDVNTEYASDKGIFNTDFFFGHNNDGTHNGYAVFVIFDNEATPNTTPYLLKQYSTATDTWKKYGLFTVVT